MRLWTLHPKYLDSKGLVALWREALLARAVLRGHTRGYRHHPQLLRFRMTSKPVGYLNWYLAAIYDEAVRRGYHFDKAKLGRAFTGPPLRESRGQFAYEWTHLRRKLRRRNPTWLHSLGPVHRPQAHPLFRLVAGPVAEWERTAS